MFFGSKERVDTVRRLVLADDDKTRAAALQALLPLQRADFAGLFRAAGSRPVCVRLLDPPLHEFLPKPGEFESTPPFDAEKFGAATAELTALTGQTEARVLERTRALRETNPLLGLRGCRVGITSPEITKMQARAIFEASIEVTREAKSSASLPQASAPLPNVQIMIPLVGCASEFTHQRDAILETAREVRRERDGDELAPFEIGVMIEVPRAALLGTELVDAGAAFFFLRDERPHADDVWILQGRRRDVPARVSSTRDTSGRSVRDDRRARRRRSRRAVRLGRQRRRTRAKSVTENQRVRRTRWRPSEHHVFPRSRVERREDRPRVVFAVSRRRCASRRRAGGVPGDDGDDHGWRRKK
mmetsp:Transcript_155039/g.376444  ORF Transcript_155039/g.376444 Transcript_155039/m.376444 type:complete len:359 (-) Transcript_155039:158-1234(-)